MGIFTEDDFPFAVSMVVVMVILGVFAVCIVVVVGGGAAAIADGNNVEVVSFAILIVLPAPDVDSVFRAAVSVELFVVVVWLMLLLFLLVGRCCWIRS